jgi:hypothetical protein
VNFGISDTATFNPQNIVVGNGVDTSKAAPKAGTGSVTNEGDLIGKYGALKVAGLVYHVQVAATASPDKYDRSILRKLCKIKDAGVLRDNIRILICDKQFDTLNDADKFLKEVRAAGQPDAFITAKYNGERKYLIDLIKMKVWESK